MSGRDILLIAQGVLIGAALGALDLALAFEVDDPSFGRRGARLLTAAAGQGALVGAFVMWRRRGEEDRDDAFELQQCRCFSLCEFPVWADLPNQPEVGRS